ncbi:GmrSD restriction endonuclease domain-containing protein [Kibdelosporangium phytohabitans]|uniref:GmrSD restriction endonucleases C-terminal domain-containing protein n=1 Tax=Kibdelosporangium phytohabitans TaxID=860235 RepID=A0A0N9HP97_9PSEU|nr:DUF1524 domain-containing protein [Kibdelosporangium phytohabitans]ALG06241.1 hypothetical protein AOZ06_04230 [Kibdelosporangium phytohabitans]MBE1465658.1 hypothetical protein [Kibdelosporangium phytohabitans]
MTAVLAVVVPAVVVPAAGVAAAGSTADAPAAVGSQRLVAGFPVPVDKKTAKTYLGKLKVDALNTGAGYDRKDFAWTTPKGSKCSTRNTILKRDGKGVTTDANCKITKGKWISRYDSDTSWIDQPSKIDVDHVVPAKHAYMSGANKWLPSRRSAFANDTARPQLIAVDQYTNRSKGDKSPDQWMPLNQRFHCMYVRAWIQVKYSYALTVTPAESTKLTSVLDNDCGR